MSNKKAVFNPQVGKQAQKEKVRKETRVSSLVQIIRAIFRKKEKEPENSRTIRFSPRSAKSIYSMVFFLLFFLISLFLLMSFGRLNTLTRLAMQKQVNREEIIESVNKGVAASDQLKYDGMKLVDRLFTVSSKLEGKEYWEAQITPYLAAGLRAEDLGLDKTNDDRVARNVRFIRLETVDYKESLYSLYYDVRFTEGKEWRQVQVILPVSYAENELKLLDRPTLMNLAKTSESNKVAYDEQRFIPKGKEVNEEETKKLTEFTNRFFELYVKNDEKLGLIANVKGLEHATLEKVDITSLRETGQGVYDVRGTYQFSYEGKSPLTSNFSLQIEATKDSYFIKKMNGV